MITYNVSNRAKRSRYTIKGVISRTTRSKSRNARWLSYGDMWAAEARWQTKARRRGRNFVDCIKAAKLLLPMESSDFGS